MGRIHIGSGGPGAEILRFPRGSERSKVEIRQIANEVLSDPAVLYVATFIERMKDRGVKVEVLRDKTPEQKMKTIIYRKGNHSFVASQIGKRFTPNNVVKELNRHAASHRQVKPKPQKPEPIAIPPLPDIVLGVKIDTLRQQTYQEGQPISIGICEPGGVVLLTHWIWYDFNKREPVISRSYPSDHKIPEAFQRQLAAKQSTVSPSLGAGITLPSPYFGSTPIQDEDLTYGAALPDDFKLWLSRHPGLTFDEARTRYREEQNAKQRRKGPRFH